MYFNECNQTYEKINIVKKISGFGFIHYIKFTPTLTFNLIGTMKQHFQVNITVRYNHNL